MKYSKLTKKFQTTIPKEVREKLKLSVGDIVIFEIVDNKIVLDKARIIDKAYLKSVEKTLTEWNSEEDDEAFKHLQDV